MKAGDLRYDTVLLAMIDEAASRWRIQTGRFLLHGFSGGGHFALRFFYLHPDRLLGVSIGAPGVVTLLDNENDWWVETRNLAEHFGTSPDRETMRQVPVLMLVGGDDTEMGNAWRRVGNFAGMPYRGHRFISWVQARSGWRSR